jgi:CRISPR-associated protein Cas2
MFDLPVLTPVEKHAYHSFHDFLIEDGFQMMQYSVYLRSCPNEDHADVHRRRIKGALPPEGEVRILTVTDKQFEMMLVFCGRERKPTERPPEQMTFL